MVLVEDGLLTSSFPRQYDVCLLGGTLVKGLVKNCFSYTRVPFLGKEKGRQKNRMPHMIHHPLY